MWPWSTPSMEVAPLAKHETAKIRTIHIAYSNVKSGALKRKIRFLRIEAEIPSDETLVLECAKTGIQHRDDEFTLEEVNNYFDGKVLLAK